MLELADGHGAAGLGLTVDVGGLSALCHSFLDDVCDFLGGLREDLVHVLSHGVRIAQILRSALRGFGVRVQRRLILHTKVNWRNDLLI